MNGQLIDGISIQVSFARRQNQDNWNQKSFVSAVPIKRMTHLN
jgi:hypothetical protein